MSTTTTSATQGWLAAGIGEAWAWPDVTLLPGSGRGGRGGRGTFVVSVGGRPRAVTRVLRPGRVSVTAVESEVAWMRALGTDGVVRIPSILETRSGTAVGVLDGPQATKWIAVSVDYEPAIAEPPDAPSDEASMVSLGTLAAQLHAHARTWTPPRWFRRPSVDLTELAGPTSGRDGWAELPLTPAALRLLGTAQEDALDAVSWAGEGSGLVHGDLRDAVVATPGVDPLLLNFECRWTWWAQDLAGSLSGLEDRIAAPSLTAAWLEGYRTIAPFDDHRLAGALIMLHRLALLSRDPRLAEGTLDVATRFVRSATWLVD